MRKKKEGESKNKRELISDISNEFANIWLPL